MSENLQRFATIDARAHELRPRLYRWWSEAMKQYAQGHLIAVAGDADEARAKVRAAFKDWFIKDRFGSYGKFEHVLDENDHAEVASVCAAMERDIAAEPDDVTDILFIKGSE